MDKSKNYVPLLPCVCGTTPKVYKGKRCDDDWGRFWEDYWYAYCPACGRRSKEGRVAREACELWNSEMVV